MWYVFAVFYQIDEDVVALTIGYDDADACLLHLSSGSIFRVHATTSEGTLLRLDIL